MKWPLMLVSTHEVERDALRREVMRESVALAAEADQSERLRVELAALQGYNYNLTQSVATLREQKAQAAAAMQALEERRGYEVREWAECHARATEERDAARRELAHATTALAAQIQAKAPKRSKLTQAIRDNARMPDGTVDRRLVNYFRAEANKLFRAGEKESDIIDSLSQWQTTENANQITADRMADLADEDVG